MPTADAETGHAMMPAKIYQALRMGRKASTKSRRDVVIEKLRGRRAR